MLQAAMPGAGVVAPTEGTWKFYWDVGLANRYRALADANYNLKDYAEAERAVRQAIVYQTRLPEQTLERKRDADPRDDDESPVDKRRIALNEPKQLRRDQPHRHDAENPARHHNPDVAGHGHRNEYRID